MSRPIAATPRLNAKATIKFWERVNADLKKPVGPVPTPKAAKGIELILKDARKAEKLTGE